MKAQDATRRDTLRLILTAMQNAEIEKRTAALVVTEAVDATGQPTKNYELPKDANVAMTDADVEAVLRKQAKMRRDAIEMMASRPEIVAKEQAELGVIESYLPQQLSRDAIVQHARGAIAAVGAKTRADQGKVMQKLMPELKGQADGKVVAQVVGELLAKGGA
jgi:uncharacterized protein YqeY